MWLLPHLTPCLPVLSIKAELFFGLMSLENFLFFMMLDVLPVFVSASFANKHSRLGSQAIGKLEEGLFRL